MAEKLVALETLEGKVLEDIFQKPKPKTKATKPSTKAKTEGAKPPAQNKAELSPEAS
jgi:hypothetical protein